MDTNGHKALGNPQTKCLVTVTTVIHRQLKPNAGTPGIDLGAGTELTVNERHTAQPLKGRKGCKIRMTDI